MPAPGERHREDLGEPLVLGQRRELAQQFRGVAPDAGLLAEQRGRVEGNAPGARRAAPAAADDSVEQPVLGDDLTPAAGEGLVGKAWRSERPRRR